MTTTERLEELTVSAWTQQRAMSAALALISMGRPAEATEMLKAAMPLGLSLPHEIAGAKSEAKLELLRLQGINGDLRGQLATAKAKRQEDLSAIERLKKDNINLSIQRGEAAETLEEERARGPRVGKTAKE